MLLLLMLWIGIDQVHLGEVRADRLQDRAGGTGMVVVEADEQIAESQIDVVMNEFGYVGPFIGGDADHIAAVCFDVGAF